MRRPSRHTFLSGVLLVVLLVFQATIRNEALALLRFPFKFLKSCLSVLLVLPQLPTLAHENLLLRTELIRRQAELAQWQETVRRAQQAHVLSEPLLSTEGVDESISSGIVAEVIGRSIVPTQHTVWIDQGHRQGLALDAVVMDAFGVVGRIAELHSTTALVMLLTDPDSRVAGMVERSRETGLLVGRGQGMCELIYLDVQADLQEGDHVITAGLGGLFPKGLPLGTVVRVTRDEQAGTAWASVRPTAHMGQLEEVLCLWGSASQSVARSPERASRAGFGSFGAGQPAQARAGRSP